MLKKKLDPIVTELSKHYYSLTKEERAKIDKRYRKFIYAENCTFAPDRECQVWHHLHENWAGAGTSRKADDIWTIPMVHDYHVPVIEKGYRYADQILGCDTMRIIEAKIIQLHREFMWRLV